jgi:hypothetical protein
MKHSFVESLESRTLFAGVTLLATGRAGPINTWMQTAASYITNNEGGPSNVPQFILTVAPNNTNGNLVASISQVAGTGTPQASSSGEIIVLINYTNISTNASYHLNYIGSVVADYLMTTPVDGVVLASLPIHEIGFSRGAGLIDEVAHTLGQSGILVDQETYLDPDPLAIDNDVPSTIYDNVEFVDNYWRNDGTNDPAGEGQSVNGAFNLNAEFLDTNHAGYTDAHDAPTGYYAGTIDTTATQGGDGPIYSNWYSTTPTMPARNETGWVYSQEVGAPRPLSGLWSASGGTGARTAAGQVGTQWGNITDMTIPNGTTVSAGSSIQVDFLHEDRGGGDTVTFSLDSNRNPYSNSVVANLGTFNLAQSNTVAAGNEVLSTAGVAPGTYWLCAKITNGQGNVRYAYESVTAPLTDESPTTTAIEGAVVLANILGTTNSGSLAGFEVTLTQHIKHAKTQKFTAVTNAAGAFAFNNLTAGASDIVHLLPRKGYKTAPHARTSFTVNTREGQVISGLTFSDDLIIPPVKKTRK